MDKTICSLTGRCLNDLRRGTKIGFERQLISLEAAVESVQANQSTTPFEAEDSMYLRIMLLDTYSNLMPL